MNFDFLTIEFLSNQIGNYLLSIIIKNFSAFLIKTIKYITFKKLNNWVRRTENICDRLYFSGYGAYSLDFEAVYFVNSNNYELYMDAQQQINLKIKAEFEKQNLEFAYPTQVNYFNKLSANSNNGNSYQAIGKS